MPSDAPYDTDLLLTMHPHGWSSCTFLQADHILTIPISHLFGDPFELLISALSQLNSGAPEAVFDWYDEPGGHRFTFSRATSGEHVSLQIDRFEESYGYDLQNRIHILDARMPLKQWIMLYYLQLRKLTLLMQDKAYAGNRHSFPFQQFRHFETIFTRHF